MFSIDVGNNVALFTEIVIKPLTNMTKKLLLTFALLCAFAQGIWAQNYDVWDGAMQTAPHASSSNTIEINTAAELAWLMYNFREGSVQYGNVSISPYSANFNLNADINMDSRDWKPFDNYEQGTFNGTNLVTAGRTKLNIFSTPYNVAAFITANGDLIGFISSTSFDNGIPEGTYSSNDNSIIYVQGMSLQTLKFASSGEATVARNGDTYTIDMTGLAIDGISGTPTMHYVGNMPNFDFPFPDE